MKRIFLVSTAAAVLFVTGCASEQPITGPSTTTVTVSPSESTTIETTTETETTTAESEETTETSSTNTAAPSEQNELALAGYVTLGTETECSTGSTPQEINDSDTPKHLDPEKKTWVWYYPYSTPGFSLYLDEGSKFKFDKVIATFGDTDRPFYGKEVLFNQRSLTDAQVGINPTQRRAFYFEDDTRPVTFVFCTRITS